MASLRITAGTLRGRRVPLPPRDVRPTSERARQAYFNIVASRIVGARFLDLFAGSGVFSFEAVSRGAASATAVEESRKNAAPIETLAAEWKAPVTVIAGDVFKVLPKLGAFDLVYADPPYDFGRYEELVSAVAAVADEGTLVAIEHRRLAVDRWPLAEGAAAGYSANGQRRTANELRPIRTVEYGEVSITFFSR